MSVIVAVLFFRMGGVTTSATVELRTWISRHVTLLCIASAACLCLYVGVYVCARICDLHIISKFRSRFWPASSPALCISAML